MRARWLTVGLCLGLCLTGCTAEGAKKPPVSLESAMQHVYSYSLNEIEPEHVEEVTQWLADAQAEGADGQFFIKSFQDDTSEYAYTYAYADGYADYEVSFIYTPKDPVSTGKIHIAGTRKDSLAHHFVQIKTVNDLSIMYIVADERMEELLGF